MSKMEMDNLKGYLIDKIIYRGNDVFTILLKRQNEEYPTLGINLIDCFVMDNNGICGGELYEYDVSEFGKLGMRYIGYTQKLGLDKDLYRQLWLKSECDGIYFELIAACKEIIVSEDVHLYNPVSENKYSNQPSIEDLRKKQ